MANQKKKRNKPYTGQGAAVTKPTVTRITAVRRNKAQQWWIDRQRFLKPVLITVAIVLVVVWLLFELIRVLSGA